MCFLSPNIRFVLTCEHADNRIPHYLKNKVAIDQQLLRSHSGWDIAALEMAQIMAGQLKAKVFSFDVTRLLVDGNRNLKNKKALSRIARKLDVKDQQRLISEYQKYRQDVLSHVQSLRKKANAGPIFVLSIHSFTPVYKKRTRKTDIGLLFRTQVEKENQFANFVRANFPDKDCAVHFNQPYRGYTDCFLNDISELYLKDKKFVGLFVEFNQRLLKKPKQKELLAKKLSTAVLRAVQA